jgi:O-antigen/teichoic acid export membrane protein
LNSPTPNQNTDSQGITTLKNSSINPERASYRQIFKSTSLFGGVQVFNIIIGIIRTKFVAVLLGTAGLGIMGLLNAPLNLIISISGLGISFSAVRDISIAHDSGNQSVISKTIIILRRWSWFTGSLGAIITITLAPLLSYWTFGNREYTWAFVWLSITLLIQAISKGQSAILQGTRRLKDMAKAGVIGSSLGLLTSIPLYYWIGIKGIVPALIITAITGLFLSWFFSRKVKTTKIELSIQETYFEGLGMAKLGIFMTLTGFLSSITGYLLNAFISRTGGLDQVGLYNSGYSILSQYVGLIFSAMATDYFPRLARLNSKNEKVNLLVSQQIETAVLILGPILCILIVFMPIVIRILYTTKFLPIIFFVNWAILGIQLKAMTWSMGYIILAKNHGTLFFIIELVGSIFALICNILGYYFYGLEGLGISFLVNYLFAYVLTYSIIKRNYRMYQKSSTYFLFSVSFSICLSSFIIAKYVDTPLAFFLGSILAILSTIYSYVELNKRIGLNNLWDRFIHRRRTNDNE